MKKINQKSKKKNNRFSIKLIKIKIRKFNKIIKIYKLSLLQIKQPTLPQT
jgi:hypothetical protein